MLIKRPAGYLGLRSVYQTELRRWQSIIAVEMIRTMNNLGASSLRLDLGERSF
jgi:hypothetical protein